VPGSLAPLQVVQDPPTQQNFEQISRAWPIEPTYAGSGSPAGAISAGPGALYRDTATGSVWMHVASTVGTSGWAQMFPTTRGTGTITMAAAAAGSSGSIAHGLGTTPTSIVCTARPTADTREDYAMTVRSRDATNFVAGVRITAFEHFGFTAGTVITFDWIAVA
jgi:hypothetical protein